MCTTKRSFTPVQTLWQAKMSAVGNALKGEELKFLMLVNRVIFFRAGNINVAVNGNLELTLLKGQRFDTISMLNLEVYKFRDR